MFTLVLSTLFIGQTPQIPQPALGGVSTQTATEAPSMAAFPPENWCVCPVCQQSTDGFLRRFLQAYRDEFCPKKENGKDKETADKQGNGESKQGGKDSTGNG